jgi:hypothetical protein
MREFAAVGGGSATGDSAEHLGQLALITESSFGRDCRKIPRRRSQKNARAPHSGLSHEFDWSTPMEPPKHSREMKRMYAGSGGNVGDADGTPYRILQHRRGAIEPCWPSKWHLTRSSGDPGQQLHGQRIDGCRRVGGITGKLTIDAECQPGFWAVAVGD